MTRKAALLHALTHADKRGLTEDELRRVAGKNWRRRLAELREDGCVITEIPSRFRRRGQRRPTYRWRLLVGPAPPPAPEPPEIPLFEPPAAPAASALTEDVA